MRTKSLSERIAEFQKEIKLWQESYDSHQDGCNTIALKDLKSGLNIIEELQAENKALLAKVKELEGEGEVMKEALHRITEVSENKAAAIAENALEEMINNENKFMTNFEQMQKDIEEAQVENPWICTSCGLSFDECSNKVSEKANLVDRALELLKHALKHSDSYTQETKPTYLWAKFNLITRSSQDLVDAIEVEKKSNELDRLKRVKPESIKREFIWKSFSNDFLYNSGFTPEQILVFEVILNSFEQMQKDIEKLKKNNQ